jgi:hypothetical protein
MSDCFSRPTPAPWSLCQDRPAIVRSVEGNTIADCDRSVILDDDECLANAQRIVVAVNNFEALVSALDLMIEAQFQLPENSRDEHAITRARAALSKCEPEKPKANLLPPSSQSTGDE